MVEEKRARVIPLGQPPACFTERRLATRYAPVEDRLWLGWWASADDFRIHGAVLENLSRTGAAVTVKEIVPQDQPIWLRLETDHNVSCVRGLVVASEPNPPENYLTRIHFDAPCPNDFFEAAIEGS